MKNFLLATNITLIVLVGILFFLHFKSDNSKRAKTGKDIENSADRPWKVAYIDLDSLQNNYKYYQKVKSDFERKQNVANDEIIALQKKYQTRAMQLQQKGPTMSPQEQENAMKEINQMQEALASKKQGIDNNLYSENTKMKDEILSRIQDFLKDYNKDGKYAYIFSYEPGLMFYKDSTLDITDDVIVGLNARREEEK